MKTSEKKQSKQPKPPKRIKIRFAGGSYYQISSGSYSAQISVNGGQVKAVKKTPQEAEKWLASVAANDIVLTAWQLSQCKKAFALIAESGGDKGLIELLQIGLASTSKTATTLGAAIDEYLRSIAGSISPLTYNDYRLYLYQLQKRLGDDLNLLAVSRLKVVDYLAQYKQKPHSYNHALRSISAFANWAIKCQYIQSNPVFGISKLQIAKSEITYLTIQQTQKLLCEVMFNRPDLIPYITISLFAGLRPYECMRLTAADINMSTGNIRLGAAKTKSKKGGGRMIKINDTLRDWLEFSPVKDCVTNLKPVTINQALRACAKAAKITLPHDVLRHTYATYANAYYHDQAETAQSMGHSVAIAQSHYIGLVTEQEGKDYFNLLTLAEITNDIADGLQYQEPKPSPKGTKPQMSDEDRQEMRDALVGFIQLQKEQGQTKG